MKDPDNPTDLDRLIFCALGALSGIVIGWIIVVAYSYFFAPFPNGLPRFDFFMVLVIPLTVVSAWYPKKMRSFLAPFLVFSTFGFR